jgi:plastocyanin
VRGGSSPGRGRAAVLSLAIVGALALGATVAWAGSPNIIATDNEFNLAIYEIPEGQRASFQNMGASTHNATADDNGPDGKPLFRTGNVSGGQSGSTAGTEFLVADTYEFRCTIHPSEMQATLSVTTTGTPVPRPEISLKVKSKKLEKVVDSGKLKVKVTAGTPTDAEGITLSAKKGAKGITKRANLNLNAGDSKTAKLKLKKNAAEKLADLEKAKVKVSGEVDFGSPDKASKKLK